MLDHTCNTHYYSFQLTTKSEDKVNKITKESQMEQNIQVPCLYRQKKHLVAMTKYTKLLYTKHFNQQQRKIFITIGNEQDKIMRHNVAQKCILK